MSDVVDRRHEEFAGYDPDGNSQWVWKTGWTAEQEPESPGVARMWMPTLEQGGTYCTLDIGFSTEEECSRWIRETLLSGIGTRMVGDPS